MKHTAYLIMLICCLFFTGCQKMLGSMGYDYNLERETRTAVSHLLAGSQRKMLQDRPILVASIVDIKNLESSSAFGQTMAEYISSSLVQKNYTVLEMKLRNTVIFKREGGTFVLSRDIKDLSAQHNSQSVIVGTYTLGDNICYIALRLIDSTDSTILSAVNFSIPLGSETKTMLGYRKTTLY